MKPCLSCEPKPDNQEGKWGLPRKTVKQATSAISFSADLELFRHYEGNK